jgi:hypothetical protein
LAVIALLDHLACRADVDRLDMRQGVFMSLTPYLIAATNRVQGSQRHPRMLFSVPVMLHRLVPGGVRFTHGISLDISESGLGALVENGLRAGETVSLEFDLPDCYVKTVAIVRHTSSARSGFEFIELTPGERQRIASLVGSA